MFTLYNVVSSDGFIARNDGSEDFIPDTLWPNFLALCREYETLVMGRKTYDAIQHYDVAPLRAFEELPIKKIVVSADKDFSPERGYAVVSSLEKLASVAPNTLVSSGPTLNNSLLKSGLVGKIILHEVPVSIGEGIRPFSEEEILLTPVGGVPQREGVKVREYRVERN